MQVHDGVRKIRRLMQFRMPTSQMEESQAFTSADVQHGKVLELRLMCCSSETNCDISVFSLKETFLLSCAFIAHLYFVRKPTKIHARVSVHPSVHLSTVSQSVTNQVDKSRHPKADTTYHLILNQVGTMDRQFIDHSHAPGRHEKLSTVVICTLFVCTVTLKVLLSLHNDTVNVSTRKKLFTIVCLVICYYLSKADAGQSKNQCLSQAAPNTAV